MKQGFLTRHGSVFLSAAILAVCAALPAAAADGPAQRVIVKYKPADSLTDSALIANQVLATASGQFGVALEPLHTIATGGQVVRLERQLTADELKGLIATIAADPNVEYAEEDRLLQPLLTPNDTRFNEQWHYFETTEIKGSDTID